MEIGKMKNARTEQGTVVSTTTAGVIKSMIDGVTVKVHLAGEKSPYKLKLTLNWPDNLPEGRVDFALVAPNQGHSFMCLFAYGSFGPKLIYSENCHTCLAKDLQETKKVEITEIAQGDNRKYECDLKHCFD